MKKLLLVAIVMMSSLFAFSQNDPKLVGYYLQPQTNSIKVYQSKVDKPDEPNLSTYDFWDLKHHYNYWFKTDITVTGSDGKKYIRITIPNQDRYVPSPDKPDDPTAGKRVQTPNYNPVVPWTNKEQYVDIDSQDFNSWLWISEDDYNHYKVSYYGYNFTYQIAAITTPLKYRFPYGTHSSSIQNGDLNLGTFGGFRIGNKTNTAGFNLGLILGINSTTMNSANNTSITDKTTSQSNTGLNYGLAGVIDIEKKFQIGFIAGWDHATGDLAKGYIYQDRMWIGFSLNYKFLSFGGDSKNQATNSTAK